MKFFIFTLAAVVLLFSGCSKDDLPKYSKLDRLRVLALVVNTPEIQNPSAGTINVNLDPYISDIGGTGNITLEVQSCLDGGVNLGVEPSCVGATNASTVQTITVSDPGGQAAGTFGAPERTGRPSTGSISVPLTLPANFLTAYSPALQFNGVSYLITVKVTSGSGSIRSFKRVLMSTKTPNNNPSLTDLAADGTSLTSLPGGDVKLSFTADTPETYSYLSGDGTTKSLTEIYETTWFVSDGEIAIPRSFPSESISWKGPVATSGRKTVVVGVLRDGRGGTSVTIRLL